MSIRTTNEQNSKARKGGDRQSAQELKELKKRLRVREMKCDAAALIASFLGPFGDAHPELWLHRTFLLIVGKIYLHILDIEKINPKEIMDLTKSLVEQRKADARNRRSRPEENQGAASEKGNNDDDQLAETLDKLIREIYGVNDQKSGVDASQSAAPACASIDSSAGT